MQLSPVKRIHALKSSLVNGRVISVLSSVNRLRNRALR
jgi:hypothetical protein